MARGPRKFRRISLRGIAPNVVTILALCAGLTAIRFALSGKWETAVFAIVLAGLFDGVDGSIARLLKSTSRFGAELDSLSDVVAFGVAPAVLLYLWALNDLGGIGWVIALAFPVCCALRLARFNSALEDDDEPRKQAGFLTGLPAPVAAGLALLPMMLEFELGNGIFRTPTLVGVTTIAVCFGMVSRTATFSFKQFVISREQMVPILLVVGLFAAAVTVYDWWMVTLMAVLYLLSIPFSVRRYRAVKKGGQPPSDQPPKTENL